jgi:FlaA1/EpsC-like NDP-sugar epimerase
VLGLSERQTVVALYGVSLSLGLLSVLSSTIRPLTSVVIWLAVFAVLVLFGLYLGRVNVYRLERPPTTPSLSGLAKSTTIIETMMLHKRRLVEVLVDFTLVSVAYVFAHMLRYEGTIDLDIQRLIIQSLPVVLVIKVGCFAGFGLYRGVWRYLGLADLVAMFKAVTLGSVLSTCALLYLWRFYGFSRSVFIIDWMLTLLAVGGSRVVERLLDDWIRQSSAQGVPILIIGAGDTGARVLRSLPYTGRTAPRVLGFLDDDLRKIGDRIHGVPVLGTRFELASLVEKYHIREVLIAISDPPADLLRDVQQCCASFGITWRIVTAGVTAAA